MTPWARETLGPTVTEAVEAFRRPSLPAGIRYALLLRRADARELKPLACPALAELARHLHRARGQAGLQLVDAELMVKGRERPIAGVSVWTLEPSTGERRGYLGFAYLGGAGRAALEPALAAEQPGPVH